MRTWTRAENMTLCGGCRAEIAAGQPLLLVSFGPQVATGEPINDACRPASWQQSRPRCATCAGEPVPAWIPERPARTGITASLLTKKPSRPAATSVKQLATDWKLAQSGGDH